MKQFPSDIWSTAPLYGDSKQQASRLGRRSGWGLAGILFMTTTLTATAATWEKLPSLPASNGGFVAGALDEDVVVLGGTNWESGQKAWLATMHRFDASRSAWVTLPALSSPLAYGIGAQVDGRFVVLGGTTGVAPFRGIMYVSKTGAVFKADGGAPIPVVLSAGGSVGGEIIVAGGTDDAANVKALSRSTFGYDPKTGHVRNLRDLPVAVGVAGHAVAGEELFVFAGAKWNPETDGVMNLDAAYAYSVARNEWRLLRPYPVAIRGVTAVALNETTLYLAGGYGPEGFTDRAYFYDIIHDTYTAALPLPYAAQVGLVKAGKFIYCIGGEDRMKHRTDAFYRISVSDLRSSANAAE